MLSGSLAELALSEVEGLGMTVNSERVVYPHGNHFCCGIQPYIRSRLETSSPGGSPPFPVTHRILRLERGF